MSSDSGNIDKNHNFQFIQIAYATHSDNHQANYSFFLFRFFECHHHVIIQTKKLSLDENVGC